MTIWSSSAPPRPHLSTPLSLWRCFLDIKSPPPHAPWRTKWVETGGDGADTAAAASANTHVNMQPQVVLLADVGDLVDGVEGAVDRGTSGGVHEERHVALQEERGPEEESQKFS